MSGRKIFGRPQLATVIWVRQDSGLVGQQFSSWPEAGARRAEWSGECSSGEWAHGGELDSSDLHSTGIGPSGQRRWNRGLILVAAPMNCNSPHGSQVAKNFEAAILPEALERGHPCPLQ